MARVTVEDCLNNVDNRFELVLLATKRARELERGADAFVKWENDKPTVVALREIAEGALKQGYYDSVATADSEMVVDAEDIAEDSKVEKPET